MKQASDSGWYATDSGAEVFIAKGTVRPDNHPDVLAIPSLFDALAEEAPPPAKRTSKDKP
jgi:hypothetical protein